MSNLSTSEGFAWGVLLTLYTGAIVADILGNAGLLLPWTENHAAACLGILLIASGVFMAWCHAFVSPAPEDAARTFGSLSWAVLVVGLTPLTANAVGIVAREVYALEFRSLVSMQIMTAGVFLFTSHVVWVRKKYPVASASQAGSVK